jgi:hypothetical protein
MTLAKDERMLDEWKRCQSENAALWAFVRADDEWTLCDQVGGGVEHTDDWMEFMGKREAARAALRQYEETP